MLYKILLLSLLLSSCIDKTTKEEPSENELLLLWNYIYTDETVSLSLVSGEPVILDAERVVIFPDKNLTMLNTETGDEEWKYLLPEGSPIVSDKIIHDENAIYLKHDKLTTGVILNKFNGNEVVTFDSGEKVFSDFINDSFSDKKLFFIGKDQNVIVFTKEGAYEKELTFDHKTTSATYYKSSLITTHSYRTESSSTTFGEVLSYDLNTDMLNWKYETASGSYLYTSILIENNTIYAGTTSGPGEFIALNVNTGEVLWRVSGLESWAYTLNEETIFINDGADLVALRKADGQQLWRTKFSGGGFDSSNLDYMDGYIYHSHSGSFFVLDANTGEIVYSTVLPDQSFAGNVSAGFGKVFVQSDFHLYAYEGWNPEE